MLDITTADLAAAKSDDSITATAAKSRLVSAFESRVTWNAREAATTNGRVDYNVIEDLEQDARLALFEAIPKFRGTTEGEFAKFGERTIKAAINDGRRAGNGVSRATMDRFEKALRMSDGDPFLAMVNATDVELMDDDRLTKEMANAARLAYAGQDYLDAPVSGEDDTTLADTLVALAELPEDLMEAGDVTAAKRSVERRQNVHNVRQTLRQLGETQRIILCALTGIEPVGCYGTENDDALAADWDLVRKQIKVNRAKGKARFAQLWVDQVGEWK